MKKQIRTLLGSTFFTVLSSVAVPAQISGNPPYTLDQSVIASGGGESASGGTFKIEGTIGQAVAGTNSTNNPFAVKSGFWISQDLAPSAASVNVGGRVLTPDGNGLTNARILLTDMRGETRTAISSAFGYYRFNEVEVGQIYIFTVVSKRYEFAAQVLEATENLDFTAQSLHKK